MIPRILHKVQFFARFFYPAFPQDNRMSARIKRGLMNYVDVCKWWAFPKLQGFIKKQNFEFKYSLKHSSYPFVVSAADVSHLWAADEIFVEGVYDLDQVPFTPDVILDLGANIGLFTILAAKRWAEAAFICVEPHPTSFLILCENLDKSRVIASKLQCAISDSVSLKNLQSDMAITQHLSDSGPSGTRTLTLHLDSCIPADSDIKLLIKMDIEGAEVDALNHLTVQLPQDTFIFVELHDSQRSRDWIVDWARENKFVYVETRRHDEIATDGYLIRPMSTNTS